MHRTEIKFRIHLLTIILALAGSLSAATDTGTTSSDSVLSIKADKAAVASQESLAVEMLLKDLDISIGDTSANKDTATVNTGIKESANKSSLQNSRKTGKSSEVVKKKHLISFNLHNAAKLSKKVKKHSLYFVGLLILLTAIFAIAAFFYWRNDRYRFFTAARLSIMDKEVQNACNYIEKHYSDCNLNIESICNALVTGEAFLQALFMRELGLTVENLIEQVRVNRAKYTLGKDPQIDLSKLAAMCGFADEKMLSDAFNAVTGSTLDDYVNSLNDKA